MKTIKVIDLLIKLKNKEEMPVEIIWNTENWTYVEEMKDYYSYDRHAHLFNTVFPNDGIAEFLDDEVEIIEEDKMIVKGIKPFKEYLKDIGEDLEDFEEFFVEYFDMLSKQVNEIIESIDDLKKKGK